MSSSDGGSEFFKGLLFGGAVGAIFALLYAPKPGKEVREDLKKLSNDLREDALTTLEETQKRTEKVLEETKQQIDELRKEATNATTRVKRTAADTLKDGKSIVKRERTRLKEAVDAGVNAYKKEKATKGKKS